ncbi:O-methyltransferase [Alkalibacter mobilis]|uniref:O-methyltransferase n=1 Tax=Alkalibacter mobilis TaxID=2787712 RepID=UPI00189D1305|nr:O-methyltransferase [Alkalibacter mobilis]MBF7095767.1 O-methyltransferase [Alkalibacter mobilis]
MGLINQSYIEDYIRDLLPKREGILKELEDFAKENSVPIIHPEVAKLIEIILKTGTYKTILEIGTAIGYSSILFANTNPDICIDTMEINEDMIRLALNNIERASLTDRINIIPGDATENIKKIDKKYDVIFLDGAKGHYIHILEECISLLNPGGMIISDNVLFRGMVASNELVKRRKITIVKRMRKYLEALSSDSRLETSVVPIGDGLALTLVKES